MKTKWSEFIKEALTPDELAAQTAEKQSIDAQIKSIDEQMQLLQSKKQELVNKKNQA